MKLGAQLYTVRAHTQTLDDFARTLERVKKMGYDTVQVSGACAFEPAWLAEQLGRLELTCPITHTNVDRLLAEPEKVADEHKVFGCARPGVGMMPEPMRHSEQGYRDFVETFLPAARAIKSRGARLQYHNHDLEFEQIDGAPILARMAEDFAPDGLDFVLDTYWVQAGGGDPADWLRRLKGRVPCVHLKDMIMVAGERRYAPIFEGNMNFGAILAACEDAGAQFLLIEQDDCYGDDPFDCLKRSYDHLHAHGLD